MLTERCASLSCVHVLCSQSIFSYLFFSSCAYLPLHPFPLLVVHFFVCRVIKELISYFLSPLLPPSPLFCATGKWLLTDDDDHFAMNLSRIGTDSAVELITAPGVTFEVRMRS